MGLEIHNSYWSRIFNIANRPEINNSYRSETLNIANRTRNPQLILSEMFDQKSTTHTGAKLLTLQLGRKFTTHTGAKLFTLRTDREFANQTRAKLIYKCFKRSLAIPRSYTSIKSTKTMFCYKNYNFFIFAIPAHGNLSKCKTVLFRPPIELRNEIAAEILKR